MERNEHLENTNCKQLCKSTLQCLISTNCVAYHLIELDELYTLVPLLPLILVAAKNWALILRGWKFTCCPNSSMTIQVPARWVPARRPVKFYPVMYSFVEIRYCSEDLHSCSLFFHCSVPFHNLASATVCSKAPSS